MTSSHRNSATAVSRPIKKEEGSRKTPPPPQSKPQEPPLKCPRCDSANTKFCYYNNYSLSQPRYFCKSCRRYWTRGGALRNVPVGGGCRKNKRVIKSSSSSFSSAASMFSAFSNSYDDSSLEIGGGFKFIHGELGGFSLMNRTINPSHGGSVYNNFPVNVSCLSPENLAVSSLLSSGGLSDSIVPENNTNLGLSVDVDTNLASSIESLSSLNQDLHRKLQQQRVAMFLGQSPVTETPHLRPFQNLDIIPESMAPRENVVNGGVCSRRECSVVNGPTGEISSATDWCFRNSNFSQSSSSPASASMAAADAVACGGGVNNGNGDGNMGNWHGFEAWSDLHHHHRYNNVLP